MNFANLITQSILARGVAIVLLALTFLAALVVAVVDLIAGRTLDQNVVLIVGSGLGAALSIVGINFGVVLQPAKTTESQPSELTPPNAAP